MLSTDTCLTCSGTPQPPRQFILVFHYSLSQWNTRQEVFELQRGRVRGDIRKSFLTEKPDFFLFSVVFYDLMDWYVSVFSQLKIPGLLSLFPEITLSRTYCYSLYFFFFLEHTIFVASRTKCSTLLQLQFYHLEVQQKDYFINLVGSCHFKVTLLLQRSLCLIQFVQFVKHVNSWSFSLVCVLFTWVNYSCLILKPSTWVFLLNFILLLADFISQLVTNIFSSIQYAQYCSSF